MIEEMQNKVKKELLAEAAKRYPIGTRYIGLNSTGELEQDEEIAERKPDFITEDEDPLDNTIDVGRLYIYAGRKWAKVISYPGNEDMSNNYEIY